ncbi:MAG: FIVAR domain-containing protein, partial [Ruminiclostridium sp.]|nr:FIVAR domain-containing protein [Ruminiclostridium sp.]
MNNTFTRHFKAITAVVTAAVMSLSASVFADTAVIAENAELKAKADKAEVVLTLPQAAAEGVSSVQVSLNITINTDNAEITFVPNENLGAKIQESRYHKDTGVLNIYAAGTSPLFDKADPTITLGYVLITSDAPKGAAANVAFAKGSLKYVRGSTLETYDNDLSYSDTVKILVGEGGEEEPPAIPDDPDNPDITTDDENNPPDDTSDPPVVNPPSGDQPQPAELDELKNALATAESYKAEDYTEDSFKILQEAIAHAKEVINSTSPTAEEIEEARMLLENAIGMLVKKGEQPGGDGNGSSSNGGGNSQNGGGNSSENGNGSS